MARSIRIAAFTLIAPALALVAATSHAGDPTMADCLTANETAIKLRSEHHLREARAQLLVCAALTCPGEVRAECERRVVQVNAAIPTIVFEVKDAAGNDLSAVTVTMDGKPLAERLDGTAISLDPGEHAFHFETAGYPAIDKSFVLREGQKDRRERIAFAQGANTTATTATPSAETSSSPPPETPATPSNPMRTWGFVAGTAGLVGLGVGSVLGLMAMSSKSNANCDANGYCTPGPLSDARTQATGSTIAFVAGGVLLAAGVTLVLLAPKSATSARVVVAPSVGERSGGVVVGGAF